ncbi:MAG TPA: helix-turn-helix domain-containing protein [Bacteroidia bacterium]|nr:helix-turn-helix domain-containing protein [Bacteroidia bacterium]
MTKIIVTTKDELQEIIHESVKSAISEQNTQQQSEELDKMMSLKEVAIFLNLAQQTVYGFTSKQQIPFVKKGKKLYFRKSELEKWLMEGNIKSDIEGR